MKIGLNTILQVVALLLVIAGFATAAGIAPLVIGVILLIGGLNVVGILKFGKSEEKGTRVFNGLIWAVTLLLVINTMGWVGTGATKTLSTNTIGEAPLATPAPGDQASAILKLNVKNAVGTTYAGSGTIYALHPGVINTRNDLMKMVQEGKTGDLAPNTMSLSSGVFSSNGFSGRVGDIITFAGYQDATPAAAENISFVATAKITGLTAGSNPEWMISTPNYVWYNYPTLLFYNDADTAVTIKTETEASAIEKTLTFDMHPSNNGEKWTDAVLWVEAPSSSIAAIKEVTITPEGGSAVVYSGIPQEVTSSENLYRAVPALTTSTDKMYKVGAFPDGVTRTSTSQKGRMAVKVTYDHPASGNVLLYFKVTQNSNALTSTGGHYDSPSTNLGLNMTDAGSDAWT